MQIKALVFVIFAGMMAPLYGSSEAGVKAPRLGLIRTFLRDELKVLGVPDAMLGDAKSSVCLFKSINDMCEAGDIDNDVVSVRGTAVMLLFISLLEKAKAKGKSLADYIVQRHVSLGDTDMTEHTLLGALCSSGVSGEAGSTYATHLNTYKDSFKAELVAQKFMFLEAHNSDDRYKPLLALDAEKNKCVLLSKLSLFFGGADDEVKSYFRLRLLNDIIELVLTELSVLSSFSKK